MVNIIWQICSMYFSISIFMGELFVLNFVIEWLFVSDWIILNYD